MHVRACKVFCFITGVLLVFRSNYNVFCENVNANYYGNTSSNMHALRFRDFEPRHLPNESSVEARKDATVQGAAILDRRAGRGFHFHADDEDISVDMEFLVPLIHVPLGRSMELTKTMFRNLVNLNTGSLVLTGAFVAIGAIIAIIVKAMSTTFVVGGYGGYRKSTRTADGVAPHFETPHLTMPYTPHSNASSGLLNDMMRFVEAKFQEHDIDMPVCVQRYICSSVKRSKSVMGTGRASGMDSIIDGLTNLEPLAKYLHGSALQNAINAGAAWSSCDSVYQKCKWLHPDHTLLKFIANYVKYFFGS